MDKFQGEIQRTKNADAKVTIQIFWSLVVIVTLSHDQNIFIFGININLIDEVALQKLLQCNVKKGLTVKYTRVLVLNA